MGRVYASKRGGCAVPSRRSGTAMRALLLFVLPLALGAGALGLFAAGAGAQGVSVQVSQCDGTSTDQSQCQSSSQQVGVDNGSSSKKSKPSSQQTSASVPQGQSAPSADKAPKQHSEVHTYSLRSGKGKTKRSDGKKQKDSVKLGSSLVQAQRQADAKARKRRALRDAARKQAQKPGSKAPVSTSAAPPATPGTSPASVFSSISSDQALAQFQVPPFLIPIYVAAGRTYGIPWNVLAGINQIETDFGRNLSVSTAGAEGWMQFMPGSWKTEGVDASGDGIADPYNPVDAIYAAARYLKNAGGAAHLREAIFSYNHADWYVNQVLHNASIYGSLPAGVVAETGSAAYGRFPVRGEARYGDDFAKTGGLTIAAAGSAPAAATQTVTVERILLDQPLADALRHGASAPSVGAGGGAPDPALGQGVDGVRQALVTVAQVATLAGVPAVAPAQAATHLAARRGPAGPAAQPLRSRNGLPAGYATTRRPGVSVVVSDPVGNRYLYGGLGRLRPDVRPGAVVPAGHVLGTLPAGRGATMLFAITAAGGSKIDPRPLVDGYRLQEAANFFHAAAPHGGNPFVPTGRRAAGLPRGHGYVFPIPRDVPWTPARIDMGWDLETGQAGVGKPLIAIGDARILHIQDMGGFGPTWITYQLLDGPMAGRTVFIGHSGPPLVQPGDTVRAGQPIIRIHGGDYGGPPGHLEIGWGNADGTNTLAAPHYSEGDHTAEGQSFHDFIARLPGAGAGAVLPEGLGALGPSKATADQEAKVERALTKITNPNVKAKPGPGALPVPRSARPAVPHGPAALTAVPSAAGAKVLAVAAPDGGRGSEAYAIGTVAGTGRHGWAKAQTVVLAFHGGAWRTIGPPQDAAGRIVNPRLRALGIVSGGSGFAVGDHGAIVRLRGSRPPTLEPSPVRARLRDVAAQRVGGRLEAYAVGERGTVLRLTGGGATREHAGAAGASLASVALDRDGTAAIAGGVGSGGKPQLIEGGDGAWKQSTPDLGLPAGARAELTAVALRGGDLWFGGGASTGDDTTPGPEMPFAARRSGGGFTTFCTEPLSAVAELGQPSKRCAGELSGDASDRGPVADLAITAHGVVAATSGGLRVQDGSSFRPLAPAQGLRVSSPDQAPSGEGSRLGLTPRGEGWALGPAGRMAHITPTADQAQSGTSRPSELPLAGGGAPGPVAVAVRGNRALAVGTRGTASSVAGRWRPGQPTGLAVRDVALAGTHAWAISETGGLLGQASNGAWKLGSAGNSTMDRVARAVASLGGGSLDAAGRQGVQGLRGLAFRSDTEGYAVGAGGTILRHDGSGWHADHSPVRSDLNGIAAGPGGVVAAGADGSLLQRTGDGWAAAPGAWDLVGGQDFTAAAALADGTLLAAGSGRVIARGPGEDAWKPVDVPPAGSPISKLDGYRDSDGHLHVVALVDGGVGSSVLLDGDASGWRPVDTGPAVAVSDLAVDASAHRILVGGTDGNQPVSLQVPFAGPGSAAPEPPPPAATAPTPPPAVDPHPGPRITASGIGVGA